MKYEIKASQIDKKIAYINFIHPKRPKVASVALAFPYEWNESNVCVPIPFDVFERLLQKGNEVNIRWSKRLNSFVVRF